MNQDICQDVTLNTLKGESAYTPIAAPLFVPENFGVAAKTATGLGLHLMGVLNACERSLPEMMFLIEQAGLKLLSVQRTRGHLSVLECSLEELNKNCP